MGRAAQRENHSQEAVPSEDNKGQKKKILVADIEEALRKRVSHCLGQAGYTSIEAADAKMLGTLLDAGKLGIERIDMVIFGFALDEEGIRLIGDIKARLEAPLIVLAGAAADARARGLALDAGADAVLARAVADGDLAKAVATCFTEQEESGKDEDYLAVNIDDFISGRENLYDIYIRLKENRYIKIAHAGQDLAMDRIKGYKTKGAAYLYMRREDFRKYVGLTTDLARAVSASSVPQAKKIAFINNTGKLIVERLYFDGLSKDAFEQARTYVEAASRVLADDDDAMHLLDTLSAQGDFLYAHSVAMSLYTAMIGRQFGWDSAPIVFKLSVSGLMADIGIAKLDRTLLQRPRSSWTDKEKEQFLRHPKIGQDVLSGIRSIPSDVPQIISQHHETCEGTGYPAGLRKRQIHPVARLLAVTDLFCDHVLGIYGDPKISPKDAVKWFTVIRKGDFDPQFIRALARLFSVELAGRPDEAADADEEEAGEDSWGAG